MANGLVPAGCCSVAPPLSGLKRVSSWSKDVGCIAEVLDQATAARRTTPCAPARAIAVDHSAKPVALDRVLVPRHSVARALRYEGHAVLDA